MAINSVSNTKAAADVHAQQPSAPAKKPKTDFSQVLANAAPAPQPSAATPKQATTSNANTLQSGDGNKATA